VPAAAWPKWIPKNLSDTDKHRLLAGERRVMNSESVRLEHVPRPNTVNPIAWEEIEEEAEFAARGCAEAFAREIYRRLIVKGIAARKRKQKPSERRPAEEPAQ
jgi:hypothetical protein